MTDRAAPYQDLERLARGLLPRMPRADHSVDLVVHGEPAIALEDLIWRAATEPRSIRQRRWSGSPRSSRS